jgi:hypothetical protein
MNEPKKYASQMYVGSIRFRNQDELDYYKELKKDIKRVTGLDAPDFTLKALVHFRKLYDDKGNLK